MTNVQATTTATGTEPIEQFDAIVIGAGVSGLYQLYRLRELGLSVRCFEDGSGVGGTWYWNRSPQAEEAWVEHAAALAERTLFASGSSWFVGANIPGKKRVFLRYANTVPNYRKKGTEVAAKGYEGFHLQ